MVVLTETSERGDYSTLAPYQQARGDYGGLDLPSILDGATAEHWEPRTPAETVRSLQLAFKHATAGRPGPCVVVLDGDAMTEEVPDDPTPPLWDDAAQTRTWDDRPTAICRGRPTRSPTRTALSCSPATASTLRTPTTNSKRSPRPRTPPSSPRTSGSRPSLRRTSEPPGVIGSFGHEGANRVVSEADVLLVVGCRLNPMDTNWGAASFIRPDEQTILHADVDPRNAGWVYPAGVGLIGDARATLERLAEELADRDGASTGANWALDRAREAREDFTAPPANLMRSRSSLSGRSQPSNPSSTRRRS